MANLIYFIIKRLLTSIIVLWAIVTLVFILEHGPGAADPIRLILGSHYTPGNYARLAHQYGTDAPLHVQYLNYLGMGPILSAVGINYFHGTVLTGLLEGNLGYSYSQVGTPVWSIMQAGVPVTLRLGLYALVLSLALGIPIGMLSAIKQNSWIDHAGQGTMMVLYAIPTFVLVPIAQIAFGIQWHLLPVQGYGDSVRELILPVTTYAAGLTGYFAKSFRSFMLEVLRQDYIRTARAKGLPQHAIIWLHAAKNTLLPLASIVGPTLGYLIVGSFIIERFFAIPGIANITVNSVFSGDYGVIEATTIALAAFVVFVNMLTDIFYTIVDPRVRL